MKNLNLHKIGFGKIIAVLILVAFALSSVGCGKKKNSSGIHRGSGYGYGYNYGGYPGYNTTQNLSAVGADQSGNIELLLSFSALNQPMYHYTTGEVMAHGELLLRQNLNCGMNMIPAGQYSISAVQPGYSNNGVISINLQGPLGPVNLFTTIIDPAPQPKLTSTTGVTGLDELNGTLTLCGQSVYIYGR